MPTVDYKAAVVAAIKSGKAVPPLSAAVQRLNELFVEPDTIARMLGKVIETDANLSVKILRQVNSPFYGLTTPIKTVTQAVVILGFGEVKYLATNFALRELFASRNSAGVNPEKIWNGTLRIACLAQALAAQCGYPLPEQIFTSTILGKTGALALNNLFGKTYAEIADPIFFEETLPSVEFHQFALNHIHLGLTLAKLWKLPVELQNAVAYQYNPAPRHLPFQIEAAFIYAARRIFHAQQTSQPIAEILPEFPAVIVDNLGLSETALALAQQFANEKYDDTQRIMG